MSHDPSEELLERWELVRLMDAYALGGVDVRFERESGGGVVVPLRRGVDGPSDWALVEGFIANGSPLDVVITLIFVLIGGSSSRLKCF